MSIDVEIELGGPVTSVDTTEHLDRLLDDLEREMTTPTLVALRRDGEVLRLGLGAGGHSVALFLDDSGRPWSALGSDSTSEPGELRFTTERGVFEFSEDNRLTPASAREAGRQFLVRSGRPRNLRWQPEPDPVRFDLAALALALEHACRERSMTLSGVAREIGVSSSTMRRYATAADAEADGVLAALGWLGVAPEDFVAGSRVPAERLPSAGSGMIRVDIETASALPSWPRSSRAASRTTIQRLVMAAQLERVSVASLTRWAEV